MAKAVWSELLARHPEPHFVVAMLPDSSGEERLSNAQSVVRLLVRLIRKLPIQGEFAVTVSRKSGQREVLCAFGDSSDAGLMAKTTGASEEIGGLGRRWVFTLDHVVEQEITKIAGLPPKRNPPRRTTWWEEWGES